MEPLGDPNTGDPTGTFQDDGNDLTFPSCKFRSETIISLIALEPSERLSDGVIGDIGGDSAGGVAGGETDDGVDRKGSVLTQEASNACLSGDPSYDSVVFTELPTLLGLC